MSEDKKLSILEHKIAQLKQYHASKCPTPKKNLVLHLMAVYEQRINLYYARLSQIA